MYYKRIDYGPFTWVRGSSPQEYQNQQHPNYLEWANQYRQERLVQQYANFVEKRPKAAALLAELFGDAAFRVFAHFKLDRISEAQCMELLSILHSLEDDEDEDRAIQAISNHIPLGNIT